MIADKTAYKKFAPGIGFSQRFFAYSIAIATPNIPAIAIKPFGKSSIEKIDEISQTMTIGPNTLPKGCKISSSIVFLPPIYIIFSFK